ncbi:TVP38/TMEM64 family protein, partial [Aquiflexum sp.]|uniref:TVP38/TMEM64 family protein n=1 Tax=Aquiflexum sp. TaxID=1872584 RepID=UPI003593DE6A
MEKKQGIFKEFRLAGKQNPVVAIALLWVSFMPSIGSLVFVPLAVRYNSFLSELDFADFSTVFLGLLVSIFLMGLALMPTTLIAGLSGFIFGWQAFPWLVLGYTLATLLGYGWGKKLSGESLDVILEKYPKAKTMLVRKSGRMGELIFFVRLSPVIPFAMSNLIFALIKSGWKKLVIFGTIGMLPRTTLVFISGTLANDLYTAIKQDGVSGKV